mgnify:CR=1 FL=1
MKTFTYTTRCKTILGDLHTPVSTYLKVRGWKVPTIMEVRTTVLSSD